MSECISSGSSPKVPDLLARASSRERRHHGGRKDYYTLHLILWKDTIVRKKDVYDRARRLDDYITRIGHFRARRHPQIWVLTSMGGKPYYTTHNDNAYMTNVYISS